MDEIREGIKLDTIHFSAMIPEGIPHFEGLTVSSSFMGYPVKYAKIKDYPYLIDLADGVKLYFSNRRKQGRYPSAKIVLGHTSSNKIPLTGIMSYLKKILPSWVSIWNLTRVDVASDSFIPFQEYIQKVMPLGFEGTMCRSEEYHTFSSKKHGDTTYYFGTGDIIVRLYNKQLEQKSDFPWSRAEFQFRGDKIRQARPADCFDAVTDVGLVQTICALVADGLHFFRPCQKFVDGRPELCVISSFWLSLFDILVHPEKLRRRSNMYYV